MAYYCFKCGTEQQLERGKAGRSEYCTKCSSDLHVCLNCTFYDKSAYNECRESQAERVLVKDRSNYCDYFTFREGRAGADNASGAKSQIDKLNDLFKK